MTISATDVSEEFLGSAFDAFETDSLRDIQSVLSDLFHGKAPIEQATARKLLKIVLATVNTEMERPENADEDDEDARTERLRAEFPEEYCDFEGN